MTHRPKRRPGRPPAIDTISDQDFIALFPKLGATELARRINVGVRDTNRRRAYLERKYKIAIPGKPDAYNPPRPQQYAHRLEIDVRDGHVLVGSDAHIWPGKQTTAMRGFIKFIKDIKPRAVILNGDVMDFSQISRHDPLGWETQPKVKNEIETAIDTLHEIERAAGRARKIWTLGNHDARFEKHLAIHADKYEGLKGMHLKDHFPLWEPCWSAWINAETEPVVVKHRFKGGDHAPWNNVIRGGEHMVTAHLHSAKVIPFTSYRRTLYGVDDGCLCDPNHRAFLYTEDNPKNWRSGFCVLSFRDGKLLQPQLALVHDEKHIDYCGTLHAV